ncbi:polysaccharide deacetylase family protein [Gilvimarinus xylanilyticus]|uniref:Polysaccharide deacetylase family protein n=1 Tax=Gilvimarinus xylanilyticus TaxID=2944139 RepID=A0A9X2KV89_9GAMM|nr:polysaccharide deacetylase family protein [Gilvimarinus xylanilyticus]MCP8900688.1 polysaccharide deacetylase family protein [Gilvimarinus xylanilyticus]
MLSKSNLFLLLLCSCTLAWAEFQWPQNQQAAVSLSYDDALNSQLDNAIPALNEYNLKGSFYLTLASQVVPQRLSEWRQAATQGHELGNHTLYHPCSKSQPGTAWVKPYNDMDKRTREQMRAEVTLANSFLYAIDGETLRTFTPPCGHVQTADGNYLEEVADLFIAIKGEETKLPDDFSVIALPNGESGEELIQYVKKQTANAGLVQIIFHGIGGDHLSVSDSAHRELLAFLDRNRDRYWTDTYRNIMTYVNKQSEIP